MNNLFDRFRHKKSNIRIIQRCLMNRTLSWGAITMFQRLAQIRPGIIGKLCTKLLRDESIRYLRRGRNICRTMTCMHSIWSKARQILQFQETITT